METLVLLPEADRAEVRRFAKNFLPILFNLYGQPIATGDTPAPRRAVLETIKTYLTITETQVSWQKGWNSQVSSLGGPIGRCPVCQAPVGLLPSSGLGCAGGSETVGRPLWYILVMGALIFLSWGMPVGEWFPGKSQ